MGSVGARWVIITPPAAEAAFRVGNDCVISALKFIGDEADTTSRAQVFDKGLVSLPLHERVKGVTLTRLIFQNTPRSGIVADHAERFRITDCRFSNVCIGIHIIFSNHGIVSGNFIEDAALHGIQF